MPNKSMLPRARAAMENSELARAVATVRDSGGHALAFGDTPVRPLRPEEIRRLEEQGNQCEEWSSVRVAEGFDWRRVQQCVLHGSVVLGRFAGRVQLAAGVEVPSGVYRSTLANCVIGHDVLVRDVHLLANYVIGPGALLQGCGTVSCDGATRFGNGTLLALGIEGGGRDVPAVAELDVEIAAGLAAGAGRRVALPEYCRLVEAHLKEVTSPCGIIERHAIVRNTPTVCNTYVGPHGRIDGATTVSECTLLSNADEPAVIESGACVSRGLLQWGSHVSGLAVVESSLLTEHSHVEKHAKVTGSLLGPNTAVGAGEVTASLLGPFVAAHHQSLTLALIWPDGKGNISYGANVGSNHTSRAPDQECRPGEGTFFGLGVNIKFPADFTRSPYSVIASGVTMLPQRLSFPFSLVNGPAAAIPGIPPAYNELVPAWNLTDNLFAVKRNEAKFRTRNKGRRLSFPLDVFRPAIIDLMRDACRRLETVRGVKDVYTDREVEGLGKNYLLDTHRLKAIEAYRFYCRYYGLLGLLERLRETPEGDQVRLLDTPSPDARWEHQRHVLVDDFHYRSVTACLRDVHEVMEQVAADVERSRARDHERGRRIIDDYADVHVPADQDALVRRTWEETRRHQQDATAFLQGTYTHATSTAPAGRAC